MYLCAAKVLRFHNQDIAVLNREVKNTKFVDSRILMYRGLYILLALLLSSLISLGQSKVSVTITNPTTSHVCQESDYLDIDVRNITTSSVTSVEVALDLPTGITYVSGSFSGTGITEKNITDLSKPVFDLPDISVATSSTLRIRFKVSCAIGPFLNGGGLAVVKNGNPLCRRISF